MTNNSNEFKRGYKDFFVGNLDNPYNDHYRSREWQVGFDKAYFSNLEKVKRNETRRRSKEVF